MQNRTHLPGEKGADTARPTLTYLELPLPNSGKPGAPVNGEPDLSGTRWLCFGTAATCALFAVWLPIAVVGAMDQVGPGHELLVGSLVFMLMAIAITAVVFLLRAGIAPGAWFRVDERGFGYGAKPANGKTASAGLDIAWSQIVPHPGMTHDVGIASTHRSEVLAPRLTFWCLDENHALTERSIPLQLRENLLQCLRFRNGHAVRVALLQGLASKGLRFHPSVFVEAGVDPESWRPMPLPRRRQWLAAIATLALAGWTAQLEWSVSARALCVLAILGLGCWAAMASLHADPRLTRTIIFRPTAADRTG